VVAGKDHLIDRYLRAVEAEIGMEPPAGPIDAVFVGGGTPSRVPPPRLGRLLQMLRSRFGLASDAEVSLGANPEDVTPSLAERLQAAGFNRISLGVQSFDPGVLEALGRRHTPEQGEAAVWMARQAGFPSINVDLILGTPGETPQSWVDTVERALDTGVDHLSAYALTVERGTPLARAVAAGAPAPDPDDQADKHEFVSEAAARSGLVPYEVSNFARPGHGCRYNLLTWAQGEYLAFGAGAHGHRGGVRRRNHRRLEAYLSTVERDDRPESGREALDDWGGEQERLLLGLRRIAGVRTGWGGERLLASSAGSRLLAAGVLELWGQRLRIRRLLLADEVSRAVLALEP
ncbi:MAG: coproporphyrinogen-III oxidase family protein, partial [Acidimicrobiia bacterium]